MVLWGIVQLVERIWSFGGQLDLLNEYDSLQDISTC
jgi:hypothetical protein